MGITGRKKPISRRKKRLEPHRDLATVGRPKPSSPVPAEWSESPPEGKRHLEQ